MKIFISADIEGVNGMTDWNEAEKGHSDYALFAERQVKELYAVCEGINDVDQKAEIQIKDGHDTGRNIVHEKLPEYVKLFRNSGRNPYIMMSGIDSSFDGTMFTGYHSGAGSNGSPLAHTMESLNIVYMKINDQLANEFLLNYYSSLYNKVPVIMVTGDEKLCQMVKSMDKNIHTVMTHQGDGGGVLSEHPNIIYKRLKEEAKKAVENRANCSLVIPEQFKLEIRYKEHKQAQRASYYPGVKRIEDTIVQFETKDYFELLRAYMFM